MVILKAIAWFIIIAYAVVIVVLYTLQRRLIFHPGSLTPDYRFKTEAGGEEITLTTADGERINGLFFENDHPDIILYFHGNAGDLSGWQYVSSDFTSLGFNFMIIDYRGYGKSSGRITEKGLYLDGEAAFDFLRTKGFQPENIIVYGRSIGSGIAVHVAANRNCKGLILESPFSSLSTLANEKLPLFFPSIYTRFRFDNLAKIRNVGCPLIILHGTHDELIPDSHSRKLFSRFTGKKKMILVDRGSHNDLHTFDQYKDFFQDELPEFFESGDIGRR